MFEQHLFESEQTIGTKMSRKAQRAAALAPGRGVNAEIVTVPRTKLGAPLCVQVLSEDD